MLCDLPDSISIGFAVRIHLKKFRVPLTHRWKHLQVKNVRVGALWGLVFKLPTPLIELSLEPCFICFINVRAGVVFLMDNDRPSTRTSDLMTQRVRVSIRVRM